MHILNFPDAVLFSLFFRKIFTVFPAFFRNIEGSIVRFLIGSVRDLTLNSTSRYLAQFPDSIFKAATEGKGDVHDSQSNSHFLAVLHLLALLYFD